MKTQSPGLVRKRINKYVNEQIRKREKTMKTRREEIKKKRKQTRMENFLIKREASEHSETQ